MPESRIDELRTIDPVLTTIAREYRNTAFIAGNLFPKVTVSKLKGKIPVFGKDAFKIRETERAMRAASNRIPPTEFSLVEFSTNEQDVESAIDYLEEEESNDYVKYEQKIVKDLCDIIKLGKEKTAADLVQNPLNYSSGLTEALSSSDAFNNYEISDPILTIKECAATLRKNIARQPNTIVMGFDTYQALTSHPKILEKIKYSGLKNINISVLRELLEVPNIYVGMALYLNASNVLTELWQNSLIIAYTENSSSERSEYSPSFGYTLQREGMPQIDTYYENGGKIKVVRNTDNYCVKIVAPDAGFLISDTIQTAG